jgi:hypothetical protein
MYSLMRGATFVLLAFTCANEVFIYLPSTISKSHYCNVEEYSLEQNADSKKYIICAKKALVGTFTYRNKF